MASAIIVNQLFPNSFVHSTFDSLNITVLLRKIKCIDIVNCAREDATTTTTKRQERQALMKISRRSGKLAPVFTTRRDPWVNLS